MRYIFPPITLMVLSYLVAVVVSIVFVVVVAINKASTTGLAPNENPILILLVTTHLVYVWLKDYLKYKEGKNEN